MNIQVGYYMQTLSQEHIDIYNDMEKRYGVLPSVIHEPQQFQSLVKMYMFYKNRENSKTEINLITE